VPTNASLRSKANISNELKTEMVDTFDMLDEEGTGCIDASKLVLALKIFGFEIGPDVYDRVSTGKPLDLTEFMAFLGSASNTQTGWCHAEAVDAFAALDREHIQSVSTAHLRRAFGRFGEKFSDAEINDQISAFDVDSSESLEFPEFVNMILMMNNKH
jgi:Ca2+-binding EF-hand superfamily protein